MNKEQITKIQHQLQDQCMQFNMQSGLSLPLSVLDTCSLLLHSIQGEAAAASVEDITDLYYAYLPAAECISEFIREADAKLEPTQAEKLAAGTKEALERMQRKAEDRRSELRARAEATENLSKELQTLEQKKQELDTLKADLAIRMEACSEEVLAGLQADNKERSTVITANEKRLEELRREAESLTQDLQKQEEELQAFPESIRKQRETYQNGAKTIEELKNAKALYSLEILEEQQEMAERLTREVERLSVRYNSVQDKIKGLEAERDELLEKFPVLETTAIAASRELLNKLGSQVDGKLDEVTALKATADRLEKNLLACNELRDRYRGWLKGVQTPLEALLRVASEAESETLRKTLDPAMIQSVRSKLDATRRDLEDLDNSLRRLTEAYGEDIRRVRKEASANG